MAKRSTSSDKVLVDPLFSIPEGAEDEFVFSREGTDTEEYVDDIAVDSVEFDSETYSDVISDEITDDSEEVFIATPEEFAILSQTMRTAPGGQQVVDIVIDAEDVAGALRYEIQVTKI